MPLTAHYLEHKLLITRTVNTDHRFHSGVYFAAYPKIATDYSLRGVGVCLCGKCGPKKRQTKQIMTMFLAKVLVGRCANCNSSDRRPPKNKRTGRLFDSTKGYLNGNVVELNLCYVIFDAMQHYPEYIIEFMKESEEGISENSNGTVKSASNTTVQKPHKKTAKKIPVDTSTAEPDDNSTQQ